MLLCKFLHEPYFTCNPTLFSSLLGGNLGSCMATTSHLAVLGCVLCLSWQSWWHLPAQKPWDLQEICQRLPELDNFFLGLSQKCRTLALVQVFPHQEKSEHKRLQVSRNTLMDLVGSTVVKQVRCFPREIFFPHHWKMLICWKRKHSWTRNVSGNVLKPLPHFTSFSYLPKSKPLHGVGANNHP